MQCQGNDPLYGICGQSLNLASCSSQSLPHLKVEATTWALSFGSHQSQWYFGVDGRQNWASFWCALHWSLARSSKDGGRTNCILYEGWMLLGSLWHSMKTLSMAHNINDCRRGKELWMAFNTISQVFSSFRWAKFQGSNEAIASQVEWMQATLAHKTPYDCGVFLVKE